MSVQLVSLGAKVETGYSRKAVAGIYSKQFKSETFIYSNEH